MTDGGDGCWRAGDDPLAPPTDPTELVERFGTEGVPSDQYYVIRVSLAAASDEYALRIIEELRRELDVLGTTFNRDIGPEPPDVFDVLVSMDYDPTAVTEALVKPSEVDAITVSRPDFPATEGSDADDAAVDEAVADVDGGPDAETSEEDETATDEETTSPELDGDSTFDRLKEETKQVDYEEIIAELDATSLPGEFQKEVDLEPLLEDDGGEQHKEGTANAGEEEPADPQRSPAQAPESDEVAGPRVANSDGGTYAESPPGGQLAPEQVVEALVTAVEKDALDDEQHQAIAEAFDQGPPKSLLVRVDHLRREVDELTAYKEALEGFIDEYGAGEGLVQRVRKALEEFKADVEGLEEDVAAFDGRIEEIDGRLSSLDGVQSRLDDQESRLADVEGVDEDVAALESRMEAIDDRLSTLDGVQSRLDDQESRLAELEALRSRLDEFEALEAELESVRADLEAEIESVHAELDEAAGTTAAIDERLETLQEQVSETTAVDDLADDLAAIEHRLEDLETWHDRITSVLTGEGPRGEETDDPQDGPAQ